MINKIFPNFLIVALLIISTMTGCGRIELNAKTVELELGEEPSNNVLDYVDVLQGDSEKISESAMLDTTDVNKMAIGRYEAKVIYGQDIIIVPVEVIDTTAPVIEIINKELPDQIEITAEDVAKAIDYGDTFLIFVDEEGQEQKNVITEVGMKVIVKAVDESGNETIREVMPDIVIKDTEFTPRDKHVYNSADADKNLLLQFLNDELPIINYIESGEKKTVYYSQLDGGYDYFYIVDMDGDGKKEFCIFITAENLIIKYNEQKECFEVWLRTRIQEKPIGDGKAYAIDAHTDTRYSYYEYDENGNLIVEKYYSIGRIYDEDSDEGNMQYLIGTEVVSKEEWEKETAYLFDMMESAPPALTYDDLLK